MSNCPIFIKPEFIDSVAIRPYEERRLKGNYFNPKIFNILTGVSRDPVTKHTCISNIIATTNRRCQIITLPSDPLYIHSSDDGLEAWSLSIKYALTCFYGLELDRNIVYIVTSHKPAYDKLFHIFEFVKRYKFDYSKITEFKSNITNQVYLDIIDLLIGINLNISLLFIQKASKDIINTLQNFQIVNNQFPGATLYDIIHLEVLLINAYNLSNMFNSNKTKDVYY